MHLEDMQYAVGPKVRSTGNENVCLDWAWFSLGYQI